MTLASRWVRDNPEFVRAFVEETALLEASELVAECIERRKVSRSTLAARLGIGRSEISQRLSGKRNLGVKSLAVMLHELGYRLRLEAEDIAVSGGAFPQHVRAVSTGTGSWSTKGVKYTSSGSSLRLLKGNASAA